MSQINSSQLSQPAAKKSRLPPLEGDVRDGSLPMIKKGNASFLNSYKPTLIPPPLRKPSLIKKKASTNGSQLSEQALNASSYITAQPVDKTFVTIDPSMQTLDQQINHESSLSKQTVHENPAEKRYDTPNLDNSRTDIAANNASE